MNVNCGGKVGSQKSVMGGGGRGLLRGTGAKKRSSPKFETAFLSHSVED